MTRWQTTVAALLAVLLLAVPCIASACQMSSCEMSFSHDAAADCHHAAAPASAGSHPLTAPVTPMDCCTHAVCRQQRSAAENALIDPAPPVHTVQQAIVLVGFVLPKAVRTASHVYETPPLEAPLLVSFRSTLRV